MAARAASLVLVFALLSLFGVSAQAADAQGIATVASLRGGLTARGADGATRTLAQGGAIFAGDRLTTGAGASALIQFTDNTRMTMGAQADISIDDYRPGDDPSFLMKITKGVFRVVTGAIGKTKPQAVRVELPVGTIGIRGTEFGGAADETSAVVVLLEQEREQPQAIEVSNQFGAVVIDQAGFGTEIPDANSPPSPPRRMRLRALDNLIRSLSQFPRR